MGIKALHRLAPTALPRVGEVGIDGTVLLVLAGATILTGLLFGLAPVVGILRGSTRASLQDGVRTTGGGGRWRVQGAFVVAQLALAVVVVVANNKILLLH